MNPEVQKSLDFILNYLASTKETLSIEPHQTTEEKKQLQVVNRSIEQLQKLGVTIPDDLRKLKLKLTDRESTVGSSQTLEDGLRALEELIESLSGLRDEAKLIRHSLRPERRGSGTKLHFDISLADLIETGFLSTEARLELQWRKDGEIYEGKLRPDGRVAVRTSSGWTEYDSLSTAASQIAGCSLNGWKCWNLLESRGKRIPLMQIRDRYIKERQK